MSSDIQRLAVVLDDWDYATKRYIGKPVGYCRSFGPFIGICEGCDNFAEKLVYSQPTYLDAECRYYAPQTGGDISFCTECVLNGVLACYGYKSDGSRLPSEEIPGYIRWYVLPSGDDYAVNKVRSPMSKLVATSINLYVLQPGENTAYMWFGNEDLEAGCEGLIGKEDCQNLAYWQCQSDEPNPYIGFFCGGCTSAILKEDVAQGSMITVDFHHYYEEGTE